MGSLDFPARGTGNEQGNAAGSTPGSEAQLGRLHVPIEPLGCGDQIIERDGAGQRAGQRMTEYFGPELGQGQQLDHA